MKPLSNPIHLILFYLSRIFLGGVFVFAAYDKILHPAAFADVIYNYQILPNYLIQITALVLPWLELWTGLLLIFGVWLPGAVLIADFLLLAFLVALLFNMARGLDIHCGCFSTSPESTANYRWYLTRDLGFLMAGAYVFWGVFRGAGKSRESRVVSHES